MSLPDALVLILRIINGVLVPLIFSLAFLVFLWGVFTFFFSEDEEKRKKGRGFALAGIIGFFLMFSIWGITTVLVNTFGFGSAARPNLPFLGGSSSGGLFQGSGGNTNQSPGQSGGVRTCTRDSQCGTGSCSGGRCVSGGFAN